MIYVIGSCYTYKVFLYYMMNDNAQKTLWYNSFGKICSKCQVHKKMPCEHGEMLKTKSLYMGPGVLILEEE